ncbi:MULTISPECIES: hypothetical protein [unclassified Tenacibaculum]|uniref:hypothetical protein n=1 Tax=unclassified Tenacibaculum TaxID=2635139 RepID=UPI001F3888BC|nr:MULTISPECIES: hypothetical protein [unclassified Tenacibaculum]MCF2874755.1 hypothetical protein [Tenacibaculum sp. Cn5-1]MCF2934179.1 hypothetical protein [Tenacibaculum sp. Cn5-34]MCG7510389.1 hypothetical protein [Tenacibaculum sp. Cn5-46]
MNKNQYKLRLTVYTISILIALVIIADFALPGKIITNKIANIQKSLEEYYNAGGNYHYSYKISTDKHEFSVTEEFAVLVKENEEIEYSVSQIFKKVNWYKQPSSDDKSFYSLRIVTGLVLPLLVILSIFIAYRYKKKMNTLLFVLQILLIADLIFLIL